MVAHFQRLGPQVYLGPIKRLFLGGIHTYYTYHTYYIKKHLSDYKFKIGALRILLSENTFAGHWETVVDCMENIGKRQQ